MLNPFFISKIRNARVRPNFRFIFWCLTTETNMILLQYVNRIYKNISFHLVSCQNLFLQKCQFSFNLRLILQLKFVWFYYFTWLVQFILVYLIYYMAWHKYLSILYTVKYECYIQAWWLNGYLLSYGTLGNREVFSCRAKLLLMLKYTIPSLAPF